MAQTSDFNDVSMARADVNEAQQMTNDYIEEMIREYHGKILAWDWRHMSYEMSSCISC